MKKCTEVDKENVDGEETGPLEDEEELKRPRKKAKSQAAVSKS